jgi:hypothetical protein
MSTFAFNFTETEKEKKPVLMLRLPLIKSWNYTFTYSYRFFGMNMGGDIKICTSGFEVTTAVMLQATNKGNIYP